MVRAADYPPPFNPGEFVTAATDPADTRIEVGVLVVGAGPAGLAFAIRFGQLLRDDPAMAERLGEVPLAVIEKGKQPGSHSLSGVIINPGSLRRLLGDDLEALGLPTYGAVSKEAVYLLSSRNALRIPTPPTMQNHGNEVASLSQVVRWLAERAEEGGAMILPGTPGRQLLVSDGCVEGVRTGDQGRGLDGSPLPNFEPGVDIVARITVLAEGTQGHLTGVALDHFELLPGYPQVWELGVKEVWRVATPLDRVIHTMGWPLRAGARYREFGGSFIYPMGEDMLSIGMVVGLDYRDVELSVHDLLQELKTHPMISGLLEGGERLEWGAKTIPGGGLYSLPTRLHAPGMLLCGDGPGMVNVPTLKGVHYAVESGRLAAETAFGAIKDSGSDGGRVPAAALASYDDAVRASFIWRDLYQVRDLRQVFGRGFYLGGALAGLMTLTRGRVSLGALRTERDADQPVFRTDRASDYPVPDGKLTFDKLSSVFVSGNRSRDDQPNHLRVAARVPEEVATMWAHLCPAQVYEAGASDGDGLVEVKVTPSNCVQCGAISAKGGRFVPPEGGSGPEYTLT
jgi:electron-transferring-flavoprotein dehydrogenase